LDPDYGNGTLDEFYILFYGSLPSSIGGDRAKAEEHFKRAKEKTKGLSAGPYVSYAQSIAIPAQDYETFKDSLEKALAIDPDAEPSNRLVNILAQRKARYLLDNAENYFFGIGDSWDEEE
ncbi:MAG: TRAP transporter TatT component family protein, partial [Spirochaetaceae bacterium]|nr:TRAP transporter TatT component family protein [Spirochaetaceae bacterium]